MKERRHHNNKGLRSQKTGKVVRDLEKISQRLKVPFVGSDFHRDPEEVMVDGLTVTELADSLF